MIEVVPDLIYLFPNAFGDFTDRLFYAILEEMTPHLKQNHLVIQDKEIPFPRLTAWFGDEGTVYKYSGITNIPLPWTPLLQDMKNLCNQYTEVPLNSCLVNYYRDGNDSIGWHKDAEGELTGSIVSVSLGATRTFLLRNNKKKIQLELPSGSILKMAVPQGKWSHAIEKQPEREGARLNFTFRTVTQ